MPNIISFPDSNQTSPEQAVLPEALLPLLSRIKNQSPENYEFLVKTICIYAHENPLGLKRER